MQCAIHYVACETEGISNSCALSACNTAKQGNETQKFQQMLDILY